MGSQQLQDENEERRAHDLVEDRYPEYEDFLRLAVELGDAVAAARICLRATDLWVNDEAGEF